MDKKLDWIGTEEHASTLRQLRAEGQDWSERRDKEIRAAAKDGMSYREIAGYLGMSHTGIQKIVRGDRVRDGGQ